MRRTMQTVAATAAIQLGLLVGLSLLPNTCTAGADRSYVSDNYLLEIDLGAGKKAAGYVKSVSGGNAFAEVVGEKRGADGIVRKHIGGVKYEPFVFQIRPGSFPELMAFVRSDKRISGTVTQMSYDLKAKDRRRFVDALLTRLQLPTLDGASKEPSSMTLTLTPRLVETVAPDSAAAPAADKDVQRVFLPANFRVTFPGLDTTKVSKVEPLVFAMTTTQDRTGAEGEIRPAPGMGDFANFKLHVAEVQAKTWSEWFDDFVLKGHNGQDKEKTMRIELLAPDRQGVLLVLEAKGVGIIAARRMLAEANADQIARIEVELYVEEWQVSVPGPAATTPPPATAPVAPTGVRPGIMPPKIKA